MGVKITQAVGARINGITYIELKISQSMNLVDVHNFLSEYQKVRNGMRLCKVVPNDESNSDCQRFKTAFENKFTVSWSKCEKSAPNGSVVDSDSTLDILARFLDDSGFWDRKKYFSSSPRPSKPTLIYTELNEAIAPSFCLDAVNTIAENVILNLALADSSFREEKLDECIHSLREISARRDYLSAIGLSLLVHASKSKSPQALVSLSASLAQDSLSIVESPDVYKVASRFLLESHMKAILLQGTDLHESELDKIQTIFVSFKNMAVRGWCGPSMAVINVYALSCTYHLENPAPMVALVGHERRHAVLRKCFGNDLNFSSPTKADVIAHPAISEYKQKREAGLWFEMTAIGWKFRFHKDGNRVLTSQLMEAILKGFTAGRVPALSDEQVKRFWTLRANHNDECALEYTAEDIIE